MNIIFYKIHNNINVLATALLLLFVFAQNGLASDYYSAIKEVITEIRPEPTSALVIIDSFLLDGSRSVSKKITNQSKLEIAELAIGYIFSEKKFEADLKYLSRSNLDNILPDSVIKNKKGHCLGLTILSLLLLEKLKINASFARAPEHVYLKICEEKICKNFEMLKYGKAVTDNYYQTNFNIDELAIKNGTYLKEIRDPNSLKASVYLGLGYVAANTNQLDLAKFFYDKAIKLDKNWAEPVSNLAAIYAKNGNLKLAKELLVKSWSLSPYLFSTAANLGKLALNEKKYLDAERWTKKSITLNPYNIVVLKQLSDLQTTLNQTKELEKTLTTIVAVEPSACDYIKKLIEIRRTLKFEYKQITELLENKTKKNLCISL